IRKIAELQLKKLAERLRDSLYATLKWDEGALNYLAERGYEPSFGARPLKRVIQQEVETPLSRKIVAGEVKEGDTIIIKGQKEGLEFLIS
ncbi:MAG: type VI secretion system ATPase TssH, partial [Thermacetogeniaceae bacterium]